MRGVERQDIPEAAIAATEEREHLARLEAQRAERRRVVAAMRESFRDVSPEEIERETAKVVAEVQAEMRVERA